MAFLWRNTTNIVCWVVHVSISKAYLKRSKMFLAMAASLKWVFSSEAYPFGKRQHSWGCFNSRIFPYKLIALLCSHILWAFVHSTSWGMKPFPATSSVPFFVSGGSGSSAAWFLIQGILGISVWHCHSSEHRFILRMIYSKWFWFPVWLKKVNIECPCPVLKDAFLCNEAVMTTLPSSLMREVHCTFIWSKRFIIVIRYWRVIGIPVGGKWELIKVEKKKNLL